MRLSHIVTVLAAACITAVTGAGIQKLEDIFVVSTGTTEGSCDEYLDRLPLYWSQIGTINQQAIESLEEATIFDRNNLYDGMKLFMAFFGFSPSFHPYGRPTGALMMAKWQKAQHWYNEVQKYLQTKQSKYKKAKLFCDSTFMQYQTGDEPYLNAFGNKVLEDENDPNSFYTLREWVTNAGFTFDDSWWFWMEMSNEAPQGPDLAYRVIEKSTIPGIPDPTDPTGQRKIPFPRDARTGQPTDCAGRIAAVTIKSFGDDEPSVNELNLHVNDVLVLCPQSFQTSGTVDKDHPPAGPVTLKTEIGALERNFMTFYHELFHIAIDDETPDAEGWVPKMSGGKPIPEWPDEPFSWINKHVGTLGGFHCLYRAVYDRDFIGPQHIDNVAVNKNPESYAWFAYTNWLQVQYEQDWSTGVCRKQASPFAPPGSEKKRSLLMMTKNESLSSES